MSRSVASTATADVSITYGDQSDTEEYPMVKKDGHWKIAWQVLGGGRAQRPGRLREAADPLCYLWYDSGSRLAGSIRPEGERR